MCVIETKRPVPGFQNEAGTHTIQRIPPTEKRGRVHTSSVTVSVLSEHVRGEEKFDRRSDGDFEYRWFSGTGKGGQRRNKVQSCLELRHIPTGISQSCHGRSRETNAAEAMAKLLQRLDSEKAADISSKTNGNRVEQIGTGVKRRTYRFRDDTVTDHFSNKSLSCKQFLRGNIDRLW